MYLFFLYVNKSSKEKKRTQAVGANCLNIAKTTYIFDFMDIICFTKIIALQLNMNFRSFCNETKKHIIISTRTF